MAKNVCNSDEKPISMTQVWRSVRSRRDRLKLTVNTKIFGSELKIDDLTHTKKTEIKIKNVDI